MNFNIEGPLAGQSSICIPILRILPEWFGIEDAILHYEQEIRHLTTFLAITDVGMHGFLQNMKNNSFC
jgi:hypothetical protein